LDSKFALINATKNQIEPAFRIERLDGEEVDFRKQPSCRSEFEAVIRLQVHCRVKFREMANMKCDEIQLGLRAQKTPGHCLCNGQSELPTKSGRRGRIFDQFTEDECRNYLKHCGYRYT